ncbi:MAG: hypothetical protein GWP05_06465 [Anaerolineaceae bacterium]|nr:hypothetical protein [Anaerolineaceae bacterium]
MFTAAVLACAAVAMAQQGGSDDKAAVQAKQVELLLKRIHKLEGRLDSLESNQAKRENRVRQLELLKELRKNGGGAHPILSTRYGNIRLKLYGSVKTDASFNTGRSNNVDVSIFAASPSRTFRGDEEFGLTARQSRLGLSITGPKVKDWDLKGRFEVDFWNGPYGETNEMRNNLRLRLAYLEVSNPETMIRAGQDWEILSPLNPSTLNYDIMEFKGNLAYRRPQVRITHRVPLDKEKKSQWIIEASINRPQGWGGGVDEGVDSGLPVFEGRTALRFPGWTGKPIEVGTSGHWGREEVDTVVRNAGMKYPTWSGNLDLQVPITEKLSFKGECYTGSNLDQFFGGANQGVNLLIGETVGASGGWAQLSLQATGKLTINTGFGVDDPNNADLSAGMISRNRNIYANAIYAISKQLKVGIEVAHLSTDYMQLSDGELVRVQSSVWFYF